MLRLDNNKLEDINGLLQAQSELQWLNVSANNLQWFDYAFIPRNLKWLDIHDNAIEELGNYYRYRSLIIKYVPIIMVFLKEERIGGTVRLTTKSPN